MKKVFIYLAAFLLAVFTTGLVVAVAIGGLYVFVSIPEGVLVTVVGTLALLFLLFALTAGFVEFLNRKFSRKII